MVNILRVKTRWSGFNGAPGYSVMHFRDFGTGDGGGGEATQEMAQAAADKVAGFFNRILDVIPATVQLDIESEVDLLESTTGELVDSYTAIGALTSQGAAGGSYSAASGAVVNWRTSGVRNGRRVRGKTFLVPLAASAYDNEGQLTASARNTIQTAALFLVTDNGPADLGVFARPTGPDATDGAWYVATSMSVPASVAILRSRRD